MNRSRRTADDDRDLNRDLDPWGVLKQVRLIKKKPLHIEKPSEPDELQEALTASGKEREE